MIDRTDLLNLDSLRQRFRDREQESEHHATVLRQLLSGPAAPEPEE
ncbi:MAG TPA: hypothetical protein VJ673_24285 [Aromatoleum sp.]|nr:hypothetical protein [Aromatoleum sp.]HJV28817.1 hypothetical protein [Aromatoleum sp.]